MTLPEDIAPDELTVERAEAMFAQGPAQRELGTNPENGRTVVVKNGRYGPYVTEVVEGGEKPRTASLFKSMSPETVTLEDALRLLVLPRVVGVDPADGEEVTAANGRYGPYIKKGSDSRSIESEEQLLTMTIDEALAIFAQPKQRGRARGGRRRCGRSATTRSAASRSWSRTAASGRTSPTAKRTRACAPGDSVETITDERAAELLAAGANAARETRAGRQPPRKKTAPRSHGRRRERPRRATRRRARPSCAPWRQSACRQRPPALEAR